MSDKIYLTGVSGIGYHGVFEQEKREGQTFTVDIEVTSDFSAAVTRMLRHLRRYLSNGYCSQTKRTN